MRSNPAHQLFFSFQPENILRSNLNFSSSYGRSTDSKKTFTKIYIYIVGGTFVPPMSISLMSKLVNKNYQVLCAVPRRSDNFKLNRRLRRRIVWCWFDRIRNQAGARTGACLRICLRVRLSRTGWQRFWKDRPTSSLRFFRFWKQFVVCSFCISSFLD